MAFWIDIAVIGTLAFCVWRGYKNGLIRGVFGVVALIASLLIANIVAHAYSKEAKGIIMPFASGIIESTMADVANNGIVYQPIAHDHDVYDPAFGESYVVLRELGLPEAASVAVARQMVEEPGSAYLPQTFADELAEKLTDTMSYVAVFGIAFLVIAIIFTVIGNLIGFVFLLPGIKYLDKISGIIFGLAKGIIFVFTITLLLRYFGLVAQDLLEDTYILLYLINNNPIADIFGI